MARPQCDTPLVHNWICFVTCFFSSIKYVWIVMACFLKRVITKAKKRRGGFIYTKEGSFFFLWAFFLFLCSIMFSTCSQLCSSSSQCVPLIAPLFIPYSLPKSSHFLTCNWVKGEALPSSHKNCYLGDLLRFQFFLGDVPIIMAHWKINK